jgi:hypothetical protein
MIEPWYTRLYKFLTGYSYAEDQERTIRPPQSEKIQPPHVLPRPINESMGVPLAKPPEPSPLWRSASRRKRNE